MLSRTFLESQQLSSVSNILFLISPFKKNSLNNIILYLNSYKKGPKETHNFRFRFLTSIKAIRFSMMCSFFGHKNCHKRYITYLTLSSIFIRIFFFSNILLASIGWK